MDLHVESADIYIPSGEPMIHAIVNTTHMGVSAHQDDIEIMAYHGILDCFGNREKRFMGIVVTNGSGSPRDGLYADYTDEDMMKIRRLEQRKAAHLGDYCAQAFLDYKSSEVKDPSNADLLDDLSRLISAAKPTVIYTHNLADKHDTHVAVALRLITVLRSLPPAARPQTVYGCEVWRDLDWLKDDDKVVLNVEGHDNLAAALLGVFDSQVAGGKRYDLATLGRRRAHATYHESHGTDSSSALTFAMDLTPLINDESIDPSDYAADLIQHFADDVKQRISKFS